VEVESGQISKVLVSDSLAKSTVTATGAVGAVIDVAHGLIERINRQLSCTAEPAVLLHLTQSVWS
jgi:hypothetical protein